ncbi:MAG: hypothetical protein K6E74_03645 [Bacilli bacterium]|nr:hypothetical protein [Bacilli bacterium]
MDYNHDSAFKKRTDNDKRMRISYGMIEKKAKDELELKKMSESRDFDKRIFDMGTDWYNSGFELSAASKKMQETKAFVDGYNFGRRLSLVKELEDVMKKKR